MNITNSINKQIQHNTFAILTAEQFSELQSEWDKKSLTSNQINEIVLSFFYAWHNSSGANKHDFFENWWNENRRKWDQ